MIDVDSIITEVESRVKERTINACLLSGGFDSFVLSYLLCKTMPKTSKLELWSIPRPNRLEEHCVKIHHWLVEQFPDLDISFKTAGTVEDISNIHHTTHIDYGISYMLNGVDKKNVTVFLGVTKNPDVEMEYGTEVYRKRARFAMIAQPFFDADKRYVVQLAHKLGILREAGMMTHSCSSAPSGRCYRCWQCSERKWAFDSVGLIDEGTE